MKRLVAIIVAVAVLGGFGIWAYAMNCHGNTHNEDQGGHMLNHEGETGHMGSDASSQKSIVVTHEEAVNIISSFTNKNIHGAEINEDLLLIEETMMGHALYRADIVLADGSKGAVYLDASSGKPMGIIFSDYEEMFMSMHHGAGDQGAMHEGKGESHGMNHQGSDHSDSSHQGHH